MVLVRIINKEEPRLCPFVIRSNSLIKESQDDKQEHRRGGRGTKVIARLTNHSHLLPKT